MQSLKSPHTLYTQQSVGYTLHNNLLFITCAAFLIGQCNHTAFFRAASWFRHFQVLLFDRFSRPPIDRRLCTQRKKDMKKAAYSF